MIPVFVQAVPWVPQRAVQAKRLAEEAGPPASVVWDTDHDAFATFRATLAAMGDDAGILLEDDIVLTEGWRDKIEAAVAQRPDRVIKFFETSKFERTWEPGFHERIGRRFVMNQCVYYPPGVAAGFVEWARERTDTKHQDVVFGEYLHDAGLDYLLHVPSLVQHQPWSSTIVPKRARNRQSRTFR